MKPTDLSALLLPLIDHHKMPPRLLAHLGFVYDVEQSLVTWLQKHYPQVAFDNDKVLFGAATHDIGKVIATDELTMPGSMHENVGYQFLIEQGISPSLARFTLTHSAWTAPECNLEDWLVSLADKVWKGKRVVELEDLIVQQIIDITNKDHWEVFLSLDDLLVAISDDADRRLAFQANQPVDDL